MSLKTHDMYATRMAVSLINHTGSSRPVELFTPPKKAVRIADVLCNSEVEHVPRRSP